MTVVSISMPESLVDRLDEFAEEHGYTGRSEVVREGARNLLSEFEDRRLEGRHLLGVITVVFNYETSNAEERMMQLRHEHETLVTSNVHSHVGDHYCMELFIVEGSLEEISGFVGKVRATQDTLSVDYSVLPVDDFDGVLDEMSAMEAAEAATGGDGHGHGGGGGHGHGDTDGQGEDDE